MEGFLTSAQQYAQITELSKRVAEWEDKIVPKLQEEVNLLCFNLFHDFPLVCLLSLLTKTHRRCFCSTPCTKSVMCEAPNSVSSLYQENHASFDIHKYGTKILHSFVTTRRKKKTVHLLDDTSLEDISATELDTFMGKIVPFKTIAQGRPAYDVSRLFLATLQLVSGFVRFVLEEFSSRLLTRNAVYCTSVGVCLCCHSADKKNDGVCERLRMSCPHACKIS